VAGLDVFCGRYPVPVVCTARTREMLVRSLRSPKSWRVLPVGEPVAVGDLELTAFPVPHDAVEPVGLVVRGHGAVLGLVSDVGHVTREMCDRLRGADALFVEANYDPALLARDTRRPWSTKQRIAAAHGHLSNEQAAELVQAAVTQRLTRVVLGHLSEDCNDPGLATRVVADALARRGAAHVAVSHAPRSEPTPLFRVRS
jgi:phosphoribosyl 1,2-cyclic phosphodiesterase